MRPMYFSGIGGGGGGPAGAWGPSAAAGAGFAAGPGAGGGGGGGVKNRNGFRLLPPSAAGRERLSSSSRTFMSSLSGAAAWRLAATRGLDGAAVGAADFPDVVHQTTSTATAIASATSSTGRGRPPAGAASDTVAAPIVRGDLDRHIQVAA